MLFSAKRKDPRLVKWAMLGEAIPLRCYRCHAIFITANEGPKGKSGIFYGNDVQACTHCVEAKHSIVNLEPHKVTYKREGWR